MILTVFKHCDVFLLVYGMIKQTMNYNDIKVDLKKLYQLASALKNSHCD